MKRLMLIGVGEMGLPYLQAAAALGVAACAIEGGSWTGNGALGADELHRIAGMTADRRDLDELWALRAYEAVISNAPDGVLAFPSRRS